MNGPATSSMPAASDSHAAGRPSLEQFAEQVRRSVGQVVVGMDAVVDQFLVAVLAGGHVLLEGVPGTAKTTLAKAFARVLGIDYNRVQFTPDLLPSDVTGTFVFDRQENEFKLRQGPIFCQLLLADEINRAPAKTQAALLEAMQEAQVTIEGATRPLPQPFLVLATQNPVEQEGVYRLPEAQLDRFLVRVEIGYPERDVEVDILRVHGGGRKPATVEDIQPQFTGQTIVDLQGLVLGIYVEPTLMQYVVDLARASREHPDIGLGASPRASLYLLQCAKARALLQGREFCTHEDVQAVARPVLGHRLILSPEAEVEGQTVDHAIEEILGKVPVMR